MSPTSISSSSNKDAYRSRLKRDRRPGQWLKLDEAETNIAELDRHDGGTQSVLRCMTSPYAGKPFSFTDRVTNGELNISYALPCQATYTVFPSASRYRGHCVLQRIGGALSGPEQVVFPTTRAFRPLREAGVNSAAPSPLTVFPVQFHHSRAHRCEGRSATLR